jgi:glucose-6-phosphate 1-dehydrogenase
VQTETADSPRTADILVLFGITGDLARKLVLPALYRLTERGELTVPIVGVATHRPGHQRLRRHVADCVRQALGTVDQEALDRLLASISLVAGDYSDEDVFTRVADSVTDRAGPGGSWSPTSRCRRRCSAGSPTGSPWQA